MKYILQIITFVYRYSGAQHIWEMAIAKDGKSPTFVLWLIGIYVALFGLASNRYESRIDIIENRANSVISQLSNAGSRKQALSLIPLVQNLNTYKQPDLFSPIDTILSLGEAKQLYGENVELLKELVVLYKSELQGVDFYYEVYEDFYTRSEEEVNGSPVILSNANLFMADFSSTKDGGNSVLTGADFRNADLGMADFSNASVTNANFRGASLLEANFSHANIEGSDFTGAAEVEFAYFGCAKGLEKAIFDPDVLKKIRQRAITNQESGTQQSCAPS